MADQRKKLGDFGEQVALAHLTRQGYRLIARQWRCPAGEIDLLMRDGATLVQNAADVIEGIGPSRTRVASPRFDYEAQPANDEEATDALEMLLGPSPVPVDELIRLSGASSGAVQMALLELDLAGRLERHAGNRVSLTAA